MLHINTIHDIIECVDQDDRNCYPIEHRLEALLHQLFGDLILGNHNGLPLLVVVDNGTLTKYCYNYLIPNLCHHYNITFDVASHTRIIWYVNSILNYNLKITAVQNLRDYDQSVYKIYQCVTEQQCMSHYIQLQNLGTLNITGEYRSL